MIIITILVSMGPLWTARGDTPLCRPFRVHMKASLPPPPPAEIRTVEACRAYYEKLDLNKNGRFDWIANVDGRTSSILYPNDPDLDGDGVDNVLDPEPMNKSISKSGFTKLGVPDHLSFSGAEAQVQAVLYRDYGILALNHTDQHTEATLSALLHVLRDGLTENARKKLKTVKHLYAFAGHDPKVNIAAYHRHMQAISIGGVLSYGTDALENSKRIAVISAFAHELGHAYLFDTMSAPELHAIGRKFGQWDSGPTSSPPVSLFDPAFFRPHPFRSQARLKNRSRDEKADYIRQDFWKESNLVSEYATKNHHEWFADSFAAGVIYRLGEKNALGEDWRQYLTRLPQSHNDYWVNYHNLSQNFRSWLEARLDEDSKVPPSTVIGK